MNETTQSYEQTGWSLTDLMASASSTDIDQVFAQLEEKVKAFADQNRPSLNENISDEQFLKIIQELEEINRQTYHLYGFASLSFSADTQDQSAQALLGRVQQFAAEMQNTILFFELWWKQLDDQNAARLMAPTGDYRYWLEKIRPLRNIRCRKRKKKSSILKT